MLKQVRHNLVQHLWETYSATSADAQEIEAKLRLKGIETLLLDHFALIDLPGPHTGISQISPLFACLGYTTRGSDYLADKQNDFLWMAEADSDTSHAKDVLPQVVIADFRLDELPLEIKKTIEKYSYQAPASPLKLATQLADRAQSGDAKAAKSLTKLILAYLSGRDWPLPTIKEFHLIHEFNELLAWVLIFGRRPNHFTLSIHLQNHFTSLEDFHHFIEQDVQLVLNAEGGRIKGSKAVGIAQGSTLGRKQKVALADGEIILPIDFMEFVWRYPRKAEEKKPLLWGDFFTGFIAQHADHVIESLYT